MADHAANVALDLQQEWSRNDSASIDYAKQQNHNVRLCFDGARRGDGSSAGGVAIIACPPGGDEVILYRAGCKFGLLRSAFEAELLALEWSMDLFSRIFCK